MKEYCFTVTLLADFELTEEFTDALYEAGCDDALVGTCKDQVIVDFAREANSQEEAITSALASIKAAIKRTNAARNTVFGWVDKAEEQLCPS